MWRLRTHTGCHFASLRVVRHVSPSSLNKSALSSGSARSPPPAHDPRSVPRTPARPPFASLARPQGGLDPFTFPGRFVDPPGDLHRLNPGGEGLPVPAEPAVTVSRRAETARTRPASSPSPRSSPRDGPARASTTTSRGEHDVGDERAQPAECDGGRPDGDAAVTAVRCGRRRASGATGRGRVCRCRAGGGEAAEASVGHRVKRGQNGHRPTEAARGPKDSAGTGSAARVWAASTRPGRDRRTIREGPTSPPGRAGCGAHGRLSTAC